MSEKIRSGVLTSFSGGELTPQLAGRVDKEEMKIGSRYVSNFIPEHQGGLKKFYGSGHISRITDDISSGCRMIPFDGCGEPLCLLFTSNKVYCVTRKEMYAVDVQVSLQMALGASYAQSGDVMYMTNESMGQAVITYAGRDAETTRHVFKSDSQRFLVVPFFPQSWQGNYNGLKLTTSGCAGHIIITGEQTPGVYSLELPDVLKNAGVAKNITSVDDSSMAIISKYENADTGASIGKLTIELHRVREGVDTIIKSVTLDSETQTNAFNVEIIEGDE
jgi:hypothetical protein